LVEAFVKLYNDVGEFHVRTWRHIRGFLQWVSSLEVYDEIMITDWCKPAV